MRTIRVAPSAVEEAALGREALGAAGEHRVDRGAVGAALVGMQQLVERRPASSVLGPAAQLAQRAVRAQQRAVGRGEHQADGGALERAGEALLGLAQRAARAHAVGDVADDAGEVALAVLAPAPSDSSSGNSVPSARRPSTSTVEPISRPSPVARKRAMPARWASR